MRPLILSGGPAVGKTTSGRALAERRPRCAFIDADDIRQLIVSDAHTLWSGPEGERQHRLAARQVSGLATGFAAEGIEVVIADVVTADALAVYRDELPGCLVVHLRLDPIEAEARARTRPAYLTAEEFDHLHTMVATPPEVDLIIDVGGLTPEHQADALMAAWAAG